MNKLKKILLDPLYPMGVALIVFISSILWVGLAGLFLAAVVIIGLVADLNKVYDDTQF